MAEHGLGRIAAPDPRDRRHPLTAGLPRRVARRNKTWSFRGAPLDQGATGACVGHGWKGWMLASPITQTTRTQEPTALSLYRQAVLVDEWPENDGEATLPTDQLQSGTSVRAGAKAVQAGGFLAEYGWAWDVDTAANWICSQGPLVIGVEWFSGMFDVGGDGFIRISGDVVGGHCLCILGWSETRGAARLLNSWGSWGENGRAWISGEDLARLLHEGGECCSALEIRRARP